MKRRSNKYVAVARREDHGAEKRRGSRSQICDGETNEQSIDAVSEEKLIVNSRRRANRNHRVVSETQIVEKRKGGIAQRNAQRRVGENGSVD